VQAILPVPVEQVWKRLMMWEDQAHWMKDADSVRVLTTRRDGVGVRIAVRTRVLHVPAFTEELEVTLWDPPRRLVMVHRNFVRGTGDWNLDSVGGGVLFVWTEDLRLPVPLLGEAVLRAYRPFMRRLMRGTLERLRALLLDEAQTADET
jgi:hypothetical protein